MIEHASLTGLVGNTTIQCSQCIGKGASRFPAVCVIAQAEARPHCFGFKGGDPWNDCDWCLPAGFFKGDRSATITVPAGVQNGSKLRVKARCAAEKRSQRALLRANVSRSRSVTQAAARSHSHHFQPAPQEAGDFGTPNGALLVRITAPLSSATVRRDGADLYSDVSVRFADPAQDSSVKVKTVDGKEGELRVPAGTKVGAALRVKGRGAPKTPGGEERGDHYFVVKTIVS